MAIFHNLDERTHIMPLVAPVDAAATAKTTGFVDLSKYNQVQFVVYFGAADTVGTIALEQANTADTTTATLEAGLGFFYRKSGADAADTGVLPCPFGRLERGGADAAHRTGAGPCLGCRGCAAVALP